MELSVQCSLLWLALLCVQCVQKLFVLIFPPFSALLSKLVSYLQARRRQALDRLQEASYRACADTVALSFVEASQGRYINLQRYGDVGHRHKKFWYTVTSEEGHQKMLTVAPLPTDCPLSLDDKGVATLNVFLCKIQHPLLHSVEEVVYFPSSGCIVMVQPLLTKGSLKDLIHKASPSLGWSAKYSKYGRSAVTATSGALRALSSLNKNQHPLLSSLHGVQYCPDSEQLQLVLVEEKESTRPLADLVGMRSPTKGRRGQNGCDDSSPLSSALVAGYGKQILEAMLYLYGLGLHPLAHVHTGNIFLRGEFCRLGGVENRLLGYKPRLYELCVQSGCYGDVDVIMFGHVIFEMACGHELRGLVPHQDEFELIRHEAVRDVLQVIFQQDEEGRCLSSIQEIYSLPFFHHAHLPSLGEGPWPSHTSLSDDLCTLVSQLSGEEAGRRNARKTKRTLRTCSIQ